MTTSNLKYKLILKTYLLGLFLVLAVTSSGFSQDKNSLKSIYKTVQVRLEKKLKKYCKVDSNEATYSFIITIQDSVKYDFYSKGRRMRLLRECFKFRIYIFIETIQNKRRIKEISFCGKSSQRTPNYYTKNLNIWMTDDLDVQCSDYFSGYDVKIITCDNSNFELLKKVKRKIRKAFVGRFKAYSIPEIDLSILTE